MVDQTYEVLEVPTTELVADWSCDKEHVSYLLADIIEAGRIVNPVMVWYQGNRIIDGMHRVAAAQSCYKTRGYPEMTPIVLCEVDESRFWELRIMSAKRHKRLEHARLVEYMKESWANSEFNTYEFILSIDRFRLPNREGIVLSDHGKVSRKDKEYDERVRDWLDTKAKRWGVAPEHLADVLAKKYLDTRYIEASLYERRFIDARYLTVSVTIISWILDKWREAVIEGEAKYDKSGQTRANEIVVRMHNKGEYPEMHAGSQFITIAEEWRQEVRLKAYERSQAQQTERIRVKHRERGETNGESRVEVAQGARVREYDIVVPSFDVNSAIDSSLRSFEEAIKSFQDLTTKVTHRTDYRRGDAEKLTRDLVWLSSHVWGEPFNVWAKRLQSPEMPDVSPALVQDSIDFE